MPRKYTEELVNDKIYSQVKSANAIFEIATEEERLAFCELVMEGKLKWVLILSRYCKLVTDRREQIKKRQKQSTTS